MTKKLVIIAQKVDINDDLLGSFVGWLKEFAKYFERVEVIILTKGEYDLPNNVFVHSLGKERDNSRLARIINFYKLLFRLVPQSSGIFAHMSPIFAVAAWPAAMLFRKKIVLWYLHRSVTWRLKLAEKICYKIVTASRDSLKFESEKIKELSHGIDLDYFRPAERMAVPGGPLKIISVGRISRIKNHEVLIRAAKILKEQELNFKIKIIGRPVMPPDFPYFEELKVLRREWDLENEVEFVGFVPYSKISPYYQEADVLINPLPSGGLDKTVLEGMAAGLIVLTSNHVFKKYFGDYGYDLIFEHNNIQDLADKILALHAWPQEKKKEAENFLRQSITQSHNKENLIKNIANLFQ